MGKGGGTPIIMNWGGGYPPQKEWGGGDPHSPSPIMNGGKGVPPQNQGGGGIPPSKSMGEGDTSPQLLWGKTPLSPLFDPRITLISIGEGGYGVLDPLSAPWRALYPA